MCDDLLAFDCVWMGLVSISFIMKCVILYYSHSVTTLSLQIGFLVMINATLLAAPVCCMYAIYTLLSSKTLSLLPNTIRAVIQPDLE